ncbi:prealbumin-like fold domain-containing protein [Photobacterium sp. DNB23_23_1]
MKFLYYFNIIPIIFLLGLGWVTPLWAFVPPDDNDINLRLQGCRNDTNTEILPNGDFLPNADDNYTCQNPNGIEVNEFPYTDGNLGTLWKELDLVPFRLILTSSSNQQEVYNVHLAADYEDSTGNGAPYLGYDKINNIQVIPSDESNGFSTAGCLVTPIGTPVISDTIPGGANKVIYQEIEVTHPAGGTCVIDWTNRLAVGASQFPGSSLQAYIFKVDLNSEDTPPNDIRSGRQVISINVEQMELFSLRKDMSATSGTGQVWDIEKSLVSEELNLGDTCSTTPQTGDVTIRVEWSVKPIEGTDNAITIETNIYAKNNLNRNVLVDIEDKIYGVIDGINSNEEFLLETKPFTDIDVPAGKEVSVTHTYIQLNTSPDDVLGLRDQATATFKDPISDIPESPEEFDILPLVANFVLIPIPNGDGIQVVGEGLPNVNISETEVLTGSGISYFVSDVQGISGSFFDGDENPITQPDSNNPIGPGVELVWKALNQSPDSCSAGESNICSVEITKTVSAQPFSTVSGTLKDWATLTSSINDNEQSLPLSLTSGTEEAPFTVNITGAPLVDLNVTLTVPAPAEALVCRVEVTNAIEEVVGTLIYDFNTTNTRTESLTGQEPDTYTATVLECGDLIGMTTMIADLTLSGESLSNEDCSDTLAFEFTSPEPELPVLVEVNKVTHPVGQEDGWIMTLEGGNLQAPVILETSDSDNTAFERFQGDSGDLELGEGTYTITETLKDGWVQTASTGCEFTVTLPDDAGTTKQCTFTNKILGKIIIHKETKPKYGTGFTFLHDIDYTNEFTLDHGQSQIFYDVVPGSYQVKEADPAPDFELKKLTCTESVADNSQTDTNTRTASIELDPGEVVECTFINRENGMVVINKLTNGHATEDEWKFTLSGPGIDTYALTPPNVVDFDGAKLTPNKKYTLCEVDVPFGWVPVWFVDSDKDGYADQKLDMDVKSPKASIIKSLATSNVFNPYAGQKMDLKGDMTFCVNFKVKPGQTLNFKVDNVQFKKPDEPKQEPPKDKCHNEPIYGQYLSYDYFQSSDDWVGYYHVDDCEKASTLLKKKVSKNNSGYLASKLYKAKLHHAFGQASCDSAYNAMSQSHKMLEDHGYSGEGHNFSAKERRKAKRLARDLDSYISNNLCP